MKPLYSQEEFNSAKSLEKLPLECYFCKNIFFKSKNYIYLCSQENSSQVGKFCSYRCSNEYKAVYLNCKNCGKNIRIIKSRINKNNFCSSSCAGTYNNKHRKIKCSSIGRSKLEIWLEQQLYNLYPQLVVHYNHSEAIEAELDIYIPSLKLAFELNGPFHYEPIYGKEKLESTRKNDHRKFWACQEAGIGLCIIDVSKQGAFKPSSKKTTTYLEIITNLINEKIKELNIDLSILPIIEKISGPNIRIKISRVYQRKVQWPLKEELIEMIKTIPIIEIGRKFGVRSRTIYNWIKHYDINHKSLMVNKREHNSK